MQPPKEPRLPSFSFDTAPLPARDRFDAWRSLLFGYELALPEQASSAGFQAEAVAWAVGSVRVTVGRLTASRSRRSARLLRRDGDDSYAVHLLAGGSWRGDFSGQAVGVRPGEPVLVDHACETHALADSCRYVSIDLPRDELDTLLPPTGSRHGNVLRGAAGQVLAAHMRTLAQTLPGAAPSQAQFLDAGTRNLLAACLAPSGKRLQQAGPEIRAAQLLRLRRHVQAALNGGDLSVGAIAWALGLSRSALYRICEPFGGVQAYVLRQRLTEARRRLINPLQSRNIGAIAADLGFINTASFSRAFRRHYGVSPSEAREGSMGVAAPSQPDLGSAAYQYRTWLTQIA